MPAPRLRHLGSRRVRLLAVAVAVAGLFIATDRVLAHLTEERLAERIACVAGLDRPPSVTIRGWPVVDQLVANHFREIAVTATGVRRPGLALRRVVATAMDVTAEDGRLTVGSLRADLTIGYSTLAGGISGGDGVVAVRTSADVAGRVLPMTIFARPVLTGDTLRFEPVEIEVLGVRVPPSRFGDRLTAALPEHRLPTLPAGLSYRAVTAQPDGLRLTVTGTRLTAGSNDTCGGKP